MMSLFPRIAGYGAAVVTTLATGALSLTCVTSKINYTGFCGNTMDAIRSVLYVTAPLGVAATFGLWALLHYHGERHPLARTLSFLSLGLWLLGVIAFNA